MKEYKQKREKTNKAGTAFAVVLTVGAHLCLLALGLTLGLTYLDPPPPEQTFLIDFTEEQQVIEKVRQLSGNQPRSENPDPTKPIELVQQSKSPVKGTKANEAQESVIDDFGDVETEQPVREKEINKRALFAASDNKANKDTLAPQTAFKPSNELKEGHASGNTLNGKTVGEPNAQLKGRNVVGNIPRPGYPVEESGKVVVTVTVDQYGKVTKAVIDVASTTVQSSVLRAEARNAAMKTHFNMSGDAPALQQGTITYNFKIIK